MIKKEKLTIKDLEKILLENFVNEDGDLDISGLDFSDFDGNVNISNMKVKKDLSQQNQTVGGDLSQIYQKVGKVLFQNSQKVGKSLYQNNQKVGNYLFQHNQEVGNSLFQNNQKVKIRIIQDRIEKADFSVFVKDIYDMAFTPKKIFPKIEKGKAYFISKDDWIRDCVKHANLPGFLSFNDFKTLCKDLIEDDYNKELKLAKAHAKEFLENEKQELIMKK